MKVAICSTNPSVMLNIVSMVAKNGCKFTKIKEYSMTEVKGHDICIFDLDNLGTHSNEIKNDAPNLSEILLLGISRSDEVLDMFRPLMNVEKKPFYLDAFLQYKSQVMETVNTEYLVNKDAERVYDSLGVKVSDLLNEQTLSNDELLDKLKVKIDESPANITSEEEFLDKIGLSDIPVPKPEKLEIQQPSDFDPFKDNALLMYRTRKLRAMHMSPIQIEAKLKELSSRMATPKAQQTSELLNKLKSGYFSTKKKAPASSPPIQKPKESKKLEAPVAPETKPIIPTPPIPEPTPTILKIEEPVSDKVPEAIDKKYELPEVETHVDKEIPSSKVLLPEVKPPVQKVTSNPEPKEDESSVSKLDVKLSPEKEALLLERLSRLNKGRGVKPKPKVEKVIEPVVTETPKETVNEETESVSEDEIDKRYTLPKEATDMNSAITKLRGIATSSKKNIDSSESVKGSKEEDLKTALPKTSLFDLIKTKVSGMEPKEDLVAKRKEEIAKKIKPPTR